MIGFGSSLSFNTFKGSSALSWFLSPEYADYAIVLDYENQRYAMPALDGNGDPILTRDTTGAFPKRSVGFTDVMNVTRYAIQPADYSDDYPSTLWSTFDGTNWSLIGGDGLGINVPRYERWLNGRQAMWVEPSMRFNRIPASVGRTYPFSTNLARGLQPGYNVSWVGDDDLVYSVEGHPEAPWSGTLTAQSTSPTGLNWGLIPQITSGFTSELTTIDRANKVGSTFFGYVQADVFPTKPYPPTSMIVTDDNTTTDLSVHVERSPEHVRVSDAVASVIGRGDSYLRAGTFILETHQLLEPPTADKRIIMGARPEGGAYYGTSFLSFKESAGVYSLTSEGPFGDLSLTLPNADATKSHVRIGYAVNGTNNLRRLAITGSTPVEDTVNPGFLTVPHFGTGVPTSYVTTEHAGLVAGSGAYYKLLWSPDVFDSTKIQSEVTL